ncbi:MAG: hypothetical protein K6E29_02625 [Cyanobacteria bacterium RUI128]|nr:hypothetical protein [Cyanobacteria bacterium RUI128]
MNNSINFTSRDMFLRKAPVKKQEKPAEEITKEQTDIQAEEIEDEYSYENMVKRMKQEDRRAARNLIGGALLAASLISAPFALDAIENSGDEFYMPTTSHCVVHDDYDKAVMEAAGVLAQGGKDPSTLEYREFKQLIDYSPLDCMPNFSAREGAKIMATIVYNPVNMNSANAKEEVLKQVKSIQSSINKLAEDYKKNPPKSSQQIYAEYAMKYVTDREILDNVDFSELQYYQNDITVLRHSINMSREKIRRDDPDADKKKQKAIENAQRLVNSIVAKYQMKASVHGNYNADDVLSKGELASLLNMENIEDLPVEYKACVITKALENYKPLDVRYATNQQQVDITNRKVDEERDKAQALLDQWAIKAKREIFLMTHPNELIRRPIEVATPQVLSYNK